MCKSFRKKKKVLLRHESKQKSYDLSSSRCHAWLSLNVHPTGFLPCTGVTLNGTMDDSGGGGGNTADMSNMYNFNLPSAYDPFKLADVLNSKTAAVASGVEAASAVPPSSVCAVEAETTIREALDELAVSEIRAVPVRDKDTGVVLGFFDATQALAAALAAAGGTESERNVLEQPVSTLIDPRLDGGRRGDGGTLPFACADLPLRKGRRDPRVPGKGSGDFIN